MLNPSGYLSSTMFINKIEIPLFNFPNDGSVNASIFIGEYNSDVIPFYDNFFVQCPINTEKC